MRRRLALFVLAGLLALFGGRLLLIGATAGTEDAAAAGAEPTLRQGQHRVALVFGAGVNKDGRPSALLRDRIRAGKTLLDRGEADLLLMTGDNSIDGYNEPGAMRSAALEAGVPAGEVAVDYGGVRTWDSCARARKVFGVRHAITVSNDFHRARTVALCKAAGITVDGAVGTATSGYPVTKRANWQARELLASWRGVLDGWIRHPPVAVGGPPIDPYDPCAVWRSLSSEDRDASPANARPDCGAR